MKIPSILLSLLLRVTGLKPIHLTKSFFPDNHIFTSSDFKILATAYYCTQSNPYAPVQMLIILRHHLDLGHITLDQYHKLHRFWTSTVR